VELSPPFSFPLLPSSFLPLSLFVFSFFLSFFQFILLVFLSFQLPWPSICLCCTISIRPPPCYAAICLPRIGWILNLDIVSSTSFAQSRIGLPYSPSSSTAYRRKTTPSRSPDYYSCLLAFYCVFFFNKSLTSH
jgi:hypothetical protein